MSLSDIMGHLSLDVYAQVALVLFLAAFAAVALNVLCRPRQETSRLSSLPLEDNESVPGTDGSVR